ncbi:unnamed protein product [Ilex paraguariensis]|uniref:RRM domain-containing protein n=1 Tax=Ilex paraguariensis TaxID=185542 RepID=A0ABC8U996_9AQUA
MLALTIGYVEVPEMLPNLLSRLSHHKEKSLDAQISFSEKSKLLKGVKFEKASKIPHKEMDQFEQHEGLKAGIHIVEVTRRANADTSKWFKQQPWEERLQRAQDKGSLVLLENLDPSYTSSEVEGIVWHAFKEKVSAKMIQRSSFSSPHSGQAFIIFRTKDAAEVAISDLTKKCLMVGNERPVVGRKVTLREPGNPCKFVGHMVIDKIKFQKQREEQRNAVSTSHFSQPNTIEYGMAMEWLALQEKSNQWWDALNEQQAKEIGDCGRQIKNRHNQSVRPGIVDPPTFSSPIQVSHLR